MPYINKPKKKRNYQKRETNLEISKIYGTTTWRKLREWKLMENPLCERCLLTHKVVPATEVHHVKPISTGLDDLDRKDLAFDPNNLMSLCTKCHHEIHNELRNTNNIDGFI